MGPFLFLTVLGTITIDMRENGDLWELLFAGDLAITADTEENLQQRYLISRGCLEGKGMKVNTTPKRQR